MSIGDVRVPNINYIRAAIGGVIAVITRHHPNSRAGADDMIEEHEVGACGFACWVCLSKESGDCPGCEQSQPLLREITGHVCPIYECARLMGVANCLRCKERACGLRRGLSKGYCPAYIALVIKDIHA